MIHAIFKRKSIRTYKPDALTENDALNLLTILHQTNYLNAPFQHKITFEFIKTSQFKEGKIGTYGFVKGAEYFIYGSTENTFKALIDYGYLFEEIILKLTDLNYGTVWLGGTFKRSQFSNLIKEPHFIPAISPVGYPKEEIRPLDRLIRKLSQGDKRLPFETLFFNHDLSPLEITHPLSQALKAVQVGPSASNKQPWRIVVNNNDMDIYLARTKNYGKALKFDIQALDIGIALYHLEVGLDALNIKYQRKTHLTNQPMPWEYVLTYQINPTTPL